MTTLFNVDACLDAFRRGDFEQLATFLADDFGFAGPAPRPLPAAGFFGLMRVLFTAFPDLDWQLEVSDVSNEGFFVTTRTAGTHSGPLDLTAQGFRVLDATGRQFALPPQGFRWTVRGGKVATIEAQPAEGVGLPGILAQLQLVPAAASS